MEDLNFQEDVKMDESITDFDIYDDLDDVNFPAEYEKLKCLNEDLLKHSKKLEAEMSKITEELAVMRNTQDTLKQNISELFNTAKNEIERKNKTIADLRRKLDDFLFRRSDNKRNIPEATENSDVRIKENEKKRPHSPPMNRNRTSDRSNSKSPKRRCSNSSYDRYKSKSNRHSPNLSSRRTPSRKSPRRRSPNRKSPNRRTPNTKSPNRSPNRKSPDRRSPNRKSPSRRSPNRKSPSRRSPNWRSSVRRSPNRKSASRRSPNRKSPSRRSPSRRSPYHKSYHSSRDSGKRSPDHSRKEERYNEWNEDYIDRNKYKACSLDKNDKVDKTVEIMDKSSIKVEENCDKKVDINMDSKSVLTVEKSDVWNLVELDISDKVGGCLKSVTSIDVETKPVVTIISDIVVKSQKCVEASGIVGTEDSKVKVEDTVVEVGKEDNKAKIEEDSKTKFEETVYSDENIGKMGRNKIQKEEQITCELALNVSSSSHNSTQEFQSKLIEPDKVAGSVTATPNPAKRRRRCVVKCII